MFSASIEYIPRAGKRDEIRTAWEAIVLEAARMRDGLVQMQLFESERGLMAIGTWRDQKDAQAFMGTGVFDRFIETIDGWLETAPSPRPWKRVVSVDGPA